MFNLESEHAW